jgi:hypothetical protein
MKVLYFVIVLTFLFAAGCTSVPTAPVPQQDHQDTAQSIDDQVNAIVDSLVARAMFHYANHPTRSAQSTLPVYEQREWLALWFAEYYGTGIFGNSKFGNDYMICYLFYEAMFDATYAGSYEFFTGPAMSDFIIVWVVDMIETDLEIEAYAPIEHPPHVC